MIRSAETRLRRNPHTLLIPGPVNVSERVRGAASRADVGHREAESLSVLQEVRQKATGVFGGGATHATVALTGSGTSALEAVLASVVPPTGHLLVLENGRFGQRLGHIAKAHRLPLTVASSAWNRPFAEAHVERLLRGRPAATHLAVVHHETSTGLLNPVAEIAKVASDRGVVTIVDAVSSLGGEKLNVVDDRVDWCVSSANKCLESLPGVSLVCAARSSWSELPAGSGTFSLDLRGHWRSQELVGEPLFTPAVQLLFALNTALDLLIAEGTGARHARYTMLAQRLRRGLEEHGVRGVLPPSHRSATMTVGRLPDGVRFAELRDRAHRAGFAIYGAPATFGEACGVANMGQLRVEDIDRFLEFIGSTLPVTTGSRYRLQSQGCGSTIAK
ncbi:MAG: pyridoxal-phosphate-dependent aminotransferase family protein [Stackebrandtia sp.]